MKREIKDSCFALYLVLLGQKFWMAGSAAAGGAKDEAVAGFGRNTVDGAKFYFLSIFANEELLARKARPSIGHAFGSDGTALGEQRNRHFFLK